MKYSRSSFFLFGLLFVFACKEDKIQCDELQNKIEEFMQEPSAESIVKIFKPGETLYWFVDSNIDAGEEVLNEECELVCIADCYCAPGSIPFCDETYLDYPK